MSDPSHPVRAAEPEPSIGSLVKRLAEDATHLFRTEVKLAKTELSQNAKAMVVPVAAIAAGAIFFAAALITLLGAFVGWLAPLVGPGWAAFIVAVVSAIVGAVLVLWGKNRLFAQELTPNRTIESLKQDVEALKGNRR